MFEWVMRRRHYGRTVGCVREKKRERGGRSALFQEDPHQRSHGVEQEEKRVNHQHGLRRKMENALLCRIIVWIIMRYTCGLPLAICQRSNFPVDCDT